MGLHKRNLLGSISTKEKGRRYGPVIDEFMETEGNIGGTGMSSMKAVLSSKDCTYFLSPVLAKLVKQASQPK